MKTNHHLYERAYMAQKTKPAGHREMIDLSNAQARDDLFVCKILHMKIHKEDISKPKLVGVALKLLRRTYAAGKKAVI